jgi:glucuronoarabinoxylan endo-1,4-beta-xylanase
MPPSFLPSGLLHRAPLVCALGVALAAGACGGSADGLRPTTGDGGAGGSDGTPADAGGAGGAGAGGTAGGAGGSPVMGADATVTVDVTRPHQALVGFGAAVAFYNNFLSAQGGDLYKVLFSDLGLDILRIANWYQNQTATGTTPTTPFTDRDTVTIVQKATTALGHPPQILMSAWSPPAYLKSNGTTKGTRGTLLQTAGVYQYGALADWWVRSLAAYAAEGVVPAYISIQNEPDFFNAGWETCQLDAAENATNAGYGRALDAVYTAIQGATTLAAKPLLVGPETAGISRTTLQTYWANVNAAQVGAVAHHLYSGGATGSNPPADTFFNSMVAVAGTAAAAGKPIFMTEFAPTAPTLFDTAWLIHDALTTEGVSAYVYWDLIWAPPAANTMATSLVTIQSAASGSAYTINDVYYAVKHFAKWTDPGWQRVEATASVAPVKASAFVSPDGTMLTIVLLNTDTASHLVSVDSGGFVSSSAKAYRTSGTAERAADTPLGPGTALTLPARAIATVVLGP